MVSLAERVCLRQTEALGREGPPCPQRRPVSPWAWGSDYREPLGSQRNLKIDSVRDANSVQSESPEVLKPQTLLQEDTGVGGTEGRADGLMNRRGTLRAAPRKEVLIKGKKPQVADLFAFHHYQYYSFTHELLTDPSWAFQVWKEENLAPFLIYKVPRSCPSVISQDFKEG